MSAFNHVNDVITALADARVTVESVETTIEEATSWGGEQRDLFADWDASDPRTVGGGQIYAEGLKASAAYSQLVINLRNMMGWAQGMKQDGIENGGA